jgi:hypothetical protein
MSGTSGERVDELAGLSIERVKRTIESVERVITRNLELAHVPGHEATAQQHVIDGERELVALRAELMALEAGDVAAANAAAASFPLRGPRRRPR